MTLTERGTALLAAGAVATGVGLGSGSLAAGALGLTMLLAVALAARPRDPPQVEVERRVDHASVREGMAVGIATRIRVSGRLPARIEVLDALPPGFAREPGTAGVQALAGPGERTLDALAVPRVPGRFTWPPAVLRWRDAAGLAEDQVEVPAPAGLTVYPPPAELRASLAASRLIRVLQGMHRVRQGGPGTEFYALREFQQGDPLRAVNWRASARAGGKLLVNERERESHARVTILADGRAAAGVGTVGCNAWVQTLRAIAVFAAAGFRMRDLTRVVLYGDGVSDPVQSRAGDAAQLGLLDAVLGHAPRGSTTVAQAVDAALPLLRAKEPVVVVSNLLGDASVDQAVARLRAFDCAVVVLALDGAVLRELAGDAPADVAAAREAHLRAVASARARGAMVVPWDPREELTMALAKAVVA